MKKIPNTVSRERRLAFSLLEPNDAASEVSRSILCLCPFLTNDRDLGQEPEVTGLRGQAVKVEGLSGSLLPRQDQTAVSVQGCKQCL